MTMRRSCSSLGSTHPGTGTEARRQVAPAEDKVPRMDVVVNYQPQTSGSGTGLRVIGIVLGLLGLYFLFEGVGGTLLGLRLPFSNYVHMVLGHTIAFVVPVVFGLILLALGAMLLVRSSGSQLSKISAPHGVAWVLQRGGVLVPRPEGEARIPWQQVRFERTPVAGRPGIRCAGPGVDVAYPEAGLSLTHQQIESEARRISSGR